MSASCPDRAPAWVSSLPPKCSPFTKTLGTVRCPVAKLLQFSLHFCAILHLVHFKNDNIDVHGQALECLFCSLAIGTIRFWENYDLKEEWCEISFVRYIVSGAKHSSDVIHKGCYPDSMILLLGTKHTKYIAVGNFGFDECFGWHVAII